MKKTLLLAFGLAGCGSDPVPAQQQMSAAEVEASLAKSYDRLDSLKIFSVGNLVLNLPAEATSCYGIPCPGSTWQQPYDEERARQAVRLEKLTQIAQDKSGQYDQPQHQTSEMEAAAAALSALKIVDVYELVTVQPKNNPECYNLPCESDRVAAEEETRRHVDQAFAIAEAAKSL